MDAGRRRGPRGHGRGPALRRRHQHPARSAGWCGSSCPTSRACGLLRPGRARDAGAGLGRAHGRPAGTPWHPGHIDERYGLFTLIVLGECIAAATVAIHERQLVARRVVRRPGGGRRGCGAARLLHLVVVLRAPVRGRAAHVAEHGIRVGLRPLFRVRSVAALGTGMVVAAASTHGV